MKKLLLGFGWILLGLAPFASGQIIPGLYDTGVNDDGSVRASASSELHYAVSGPAALDYVLDNHPAWVANTSVSKWIGPAASGSGLADTPDGDYTYTLSFTLPTSWAASAAVITGRWTTDNAGTDILVNGVSSGQTIAFDNGAGGPPYSFDHWTSFTLSNGFQTGTNTIAFKVNNAPYAEANPSGVRVEFLTAIPEPSIYAAVFGISVLGIVLARHRLSKAA